MEISLGPITYKYGKKYGLKKREKIISFSTGIILYILVTLFGFLINLNELHRILLSIIIPVIVVIGLKRYYMYQYAKSKREDIESFK